MTAEGPGIRSRGDGRKPAVPQPQPKKKKPRRFYDYSLLFTIIFLTVFGLVMIYSSSSYNAQVLGQGPAYYMKRQGYIALAGFAAMLVISKMDYHFFAKFTVPAIVVSYICMFLVNFTSLGIKVNGQKRWLGTRSVRFQPTELVKVTVILVAGGGDHPAGEKRSMSGGAGEC